MSCVNCKFYEQVDLDGGFCRRYAPSPNDHRMESTEWPIVSYDDWCGDYEIAIDSVAIGVKSAQQPVRAELLSISAIEQLPDAEDLWAEINEL